MHRFLKQIVWFSLKNIEPASLEAYAGVKFPEMNCFMQFLKICRNLSNVITRSRNSAFIFGFEGVLFTRSMENSELSFSSQKEFFHGNSLCSL